MAEAIPYGTVSDILFKLVSRAWQELELIFGQNEELEKLQETLTTINAFILDAEEKQESSHTVKNWVIRLQDIVYDADDLLDEADYEILRHKVRARGQVRKFFSSSNPLAYSLKMGHRIKEIRERLDTVAADMSKFNLREKVLVLDMKAKSNDRETASKVKSEIIGREEDKGHVIKSLLQKQNDFHGDSISIVAIIGFGGLGKTSLAQSVYNDATVENFFKPRIWVCVSEEFDVCIIFKKILKSIVGGKVDDLDLDQIQRQLEDNLKGQRYLLVLDDVWNEDNLKWDKFSEYLVFGAPGSKILVTTRSKKVACTMGVHIPHVLQGLNEDQSWTLFEQVAFKGQCKIDPNLRVIGKDVARRCKGIPLAIKCLAGLMRQKLNEKYWSSIQENEIWKLLEKDDGVFPVLRLSYDHLPSHLKQCFAFCSLFSKDSEIYQDKLIQQWRAQGYIQLMENENIQDIGDEYFNDLLSRSLLQEEGEDEKGNIICKMHDLIHDLALLVAKSNFHWMKDDKETIPKGVRHVSLECEYEQNQKVVLTHLSKAKGIRTLHFRTHISKNVFIRDATFSSFNCLRMLNLSYMKIVILPNLIGELKHLRYLDLSHNYDLEVLPGAIVKLHNLQTLLLYCCDKLKELPRDIQQLISLEYLNIDGCFTLKCLPKGLGNLTSLQRLHRFIVNNIVEKGFSIAATLNELRDLNDLGNYLTIENLSKVRNAELESMEANLKEKKRLQCLRLWWQPNAGEDSEKVELLLDNLEPHPNLKELEVRRYGGARFSTWLSSLNNLVKLDIDGCWNCQHLPRLDHLSSLKSLTLQGFHVLEQLPPLDHLSSLESLTLHGFHVLEHVEDSFPLPCSTPGASFFPSLKKLSIRDCPNLKGWWRNQGSTVELPWFPCLSELDIWLRQNLTSMPLFPSLDQYLTLYGTSIMPLQQTLKMKITKASTTSEASSSRSTCHSYSYSSTALPLSNLKHLTLASVDDLEDLSEEFFQNLTSLTCLIFSDCDKLESLLPQKMNRLTSLQELQVGNCPNLRALPDWIPNLISLKTLKIQWCPKLQSLPDGMQQLTSLQQLLIDGCPRLSKICKKETGIH
ncbi:putative disease resistance protein RGA1 [Herrania umbratica]|uniref:Disease resistance protein RGA1 n=1 Tax=Herrania umbratica TaxID=108875 RepID=A0A6J1ANK3_9ROSI|nr:putative disease resistance protein RGA1 [Herrania umbratica]